jgi:A/G-specific adenine glycosylase
VSDQLWALAERNTPHERVADYTQAIMDLGATCCKRTLPSCTTCPMQTKVPRTRHSKPSGLSRSQAAKAKALAATLVCHCHHIIGRGAIAEACGHRNLGRVVGATGILE